jgi:hypothetical protein
MTPVRPRRRPVWIIWYAVLLHTLWGCLLLASRSPLGATPLHVYDPVPRGLMAAIFLAISGLAAWGATRRQPSWQTLVALLPQQAILTVSAAAAIVAIASAHYGDGIARPRLFILADQAPAILVLVLHTAAIASLHARRPGGQALRAALAAMDAETERLREKVAGQAGPLNAGNGQAVTPEAGNGQEQRSPGPQDAPADPRLTSDPAGAERPGD